VDYSVSNALNFNSHGLEELLLIYDVYCQYGVHFEDRLEDMPQYLSIDPGMKILGAIGKFHLADHVDSCFSKYTLNFMKGAGHIDGETMETLWSGMNKVSGSARSMSKSHRQETLDDYMRDWNWRKTVGIGKFLHLKCKVYCLLCHFSVPTLLTKLKRSQIGLNSTQPAFDELTKSCLQRNLPVDSWRCDEALAMEERGESLKIFDINRKKAPTLAEITLQLCEERGKLDDIGGDVVDWIADGIKAENDKWVFKLKLHP